MKKGILIVVLMSFIQQMNMFAQAPQWEWAKLCNGNNSQEGRGIAVDREGNSYIAGIFYGTITFDNITFTSRGANDIYIAKLDACGKVSWAKQAGGRGSDGAIGICIDNYGNSYITGYVADTAQFDNNQVVTTHGENIFVAKYNNNGNNVWVRNSTGLANWQNIGICLNVDNNGNVYFAGGIGAPTITFDTITISNAGYSSGIFIGKYDSNGNILWVKNTGTISVGVTDVDIYAITVDHFGNSYVTGTFEQTIHFGSYVFHSIPSVNGWISSDIFIVKYDTYGNIVWAKQQGGNGADSGSGICVDALGNSYISGSYSMTAHFDASSLTAPTTTQMEAFIAKYDASGNNIWAKKNFSSGMGITMDRNGELYTPCVKYTASGDTIWTKPTGVYLYNYGGGVDDSLNVYFCGFLQGTATLDTFHLTSMGAVSMFVGKLLVNQATNCFGVVTSAGNNNAQDLISIYPNPTTSSFTIASTNKIQSIKMFNVLGECIYQIEPNTNQSTINSSQFAKGIYFVQITPCIGSLNDKNIINKKIIIQ